jgi:hypothetical protein
MSPNRKHKSPPETSRSYDATATLTLDLDNVRLTMPAETVAVLAAALDLRSPRVAAPDPSPYLTVSEAAAYLHASRQRIYDLLSSRRLPKY